MRELSAKRILYVRKHDRKATHSTVGRIRVLCRVEGSELEDGDPEIK